VFRAFSWYSCVTYDTVPFVQLFRHCAVSEWWGRTVGLCGSSYVGNFSCAVPSTARGKPDRSWRQFSYPRPTSKHQSQLFIMRVIIVMERLVCWLVLERVGGSALSSMAWLLWVVYKSPKPCFSLSVSYPPPQAPFDHIWATVWPGARGNITITAL